MRARSWLNSAAPGTMATLILCTAACSSAPGGGGFGAPPGVATDLRGLCPDPVVVQAAWYPDITHSFYELVGDGYTVDSRRATVTAPLVAPDGDSSTSTGIRIQIRSGGPVVGFVPADELMERDKSITFGNQGTDEQLLAATRGRRILSVFAPLDQDPVVFMWDREKHPDFRTVQDVGQTDAPVYTIPDDPSTLYLLQTGVLRGRQIVPGFDGTPRPWLSGGGVGVLGGYITKDPYIARLLAPSRTLEVAMLADAGYPNYRTTLTIRSADRDRLDGCLRRLVPIMQRAHARFMTDPERQIRLVVDLNIAYKAPYPFNETIARYGVDQIRRNALIFAGRDNRIGDQDLTPVSGRIARMIKTLTPVYAARRTPLPPLQPSDIATNDYLSPIGLD